MSLLDWDFDDLARRLQSGLDRLTVSFLRGHHAKIQQDTVDFHGQEHIELVLEHDGHRLELRQFGPLEESAPDPSGTAATREFRSLFDGRPARDVPLPTLAAWLSSLPAGVAQAERLAAPPPPDNPFAPAPRAPAAPLAGNPFQSSGAPATIPNPFAQPAGDERRQRALDWLQGDGDA